MPTILNTLQKACDVLQAVTDTPMLDAELLLCHSLQKPRSFLHSHATDLLSDSAQTQFNTLLERRLAKEPVAYLLGEWEFWSLTLKVTPDTLIPRPDTEVLVEQALQRIPTQAKRKVVDLGTGSGAVALAIASERPNAEVTATDLSTAALSIAQHNATINQLTQVRFIASDWFEQLAGQQFDVIASNPPYIASDDAHLQQLTFEPLSALASGADGLTAIRHLITQAPAYLTPAGWLLLEHGFEQAPAIQKLLVEHGFTQVTTVQDLAQRDRVTLGQFLGRH